MKHSLQSLTLFALAFALAPHGCTGTESGNPRCAFPVCGKPMRLVGAIEGELDSAEWRVTGIISDSDPSRVYLDGNEVDPMSCGRLPETVGAGLGAELSWAASEASVDAAGNL